MAGVTWRDLDEELRRWREAGRTADLWWRDDDASAPSGALATLLDLSRRSAVPLALAVVPNTAVPGLFEKPGATVLMHGTDHVNRARPGGKKSEFPESEPAEAALARIAAGHARLESLAGDTYLPVLAPPWNRLPPALAARLAECGLRGLSTYGPRARALVAPGVRQVNTHVDIIDWRGARGFVGEQAALGALVRHLCARRRDQLDAGEATGVLTHHAVHDAASWDFLERLLDRTRAGGAQWREAAALFPSAG
jgi:peptidoglycan/xylan/chitin deacetylase (PgdA/CDA1 family)